MYVPAGLCVSRAVGLIIPSHWPPRLFLSSVLSRFVNCDSNDKPGQLEILPNPNIYLAGLELHWGCLTGRREPPSHPRPSD